MTRTRCPAQPSVRVGQIWRDNDKRSERWVRIVGVVMRSGGKGAAEIVRCTADGGNIAGAHTNWTLLRRFSGRLDGFSIHTDVAGGKI